MASRTLNSKRNIIAGILSNCVVPVFALIVKSVIVRCLSVEYIGLTGVFSAVFQVLNLAELGFFAAIMVNLYMPLRDEDTAAVRGILAYYRRVYRIIGFVILTAGAALCPMLGKLVGDTGGVSENIRILYLIFLVERVTGFVTFTYKEALFNAAQRLDMTKLLYIVIYVIRSCLQLAAVAVFGSFYLYAAVTLVSAILYNIFLDILSRRCFPQYYPEGDVTEETKHRIRKQVTGLTVSNILGVSRDSLNTIMVTSFLGLHAAGQHSNYCAVYDGIMGFFLVVTKAVMSSIGNSIVSESVEKNYSDLNKIEFLHNIAVTACTAYMISLYQPFMKLWMGEELMLSDPVMMLFVLYFYIRAMSEVRNAYFSALGYWWQARWIFLAEALINVALMYCLGKLLGMAGILMAPCITVLTVNYIGITDLIFREYFKTGRKEYYHNRILYTVITVAVCSGAWYSCGMVPCEGIPGLVARIAVCTLELVITVPAFMYLMKREYFKESLSFIRQIIDAG